MAINEEQKRYILEGLAEGLTGGMATLIVWIFVALGLLFSDTSIAFLRISASVVGAVVAVVAVVAVTGTNLDGRADLRTGVPVLVAVDMILLLR